MAAFIGVEFAGLLSSLFGFVLVFEIKGADLSAITGANKRRLMALWILISVSMAILLTWYVTKNGFSQNLVFLPSALGLVLSVVGLIVVKRLPDTAADPANSSLSVRVRRSLLSLFLGVGGFFLYSLWRLPDQQGGASQAALGLIPQGLIVAAAVAISLYFVIKEKPGALASDGDQMPVGTRRVLVLYLLGLGIGLLILLWRIGSIEFPQSGFKIETHVLGDTATAATAQISSGTQNVSNEKHPVLDQLFPEAPSTAVPVVYLDAYGQNFTPGSKLRFNQQVQPTVFVDDSRIQALLDPATIESVDPISVDVVTKATASTGEQVTRTIVMTVRKVHATDEVLGLHVDLTRELQLLLLSMLAGALGSFVHALKSFGDFVGNRTLTASWFWWYITRPYLGASLAVIFYAVLRGGLMAGTQADAKTVNQFGVIAMSALVGMFADKASDKLAEIFDTLFTGADKRSGKLAAPIISGFDPETITHGAPAQNLKIIGDRLGAVTQVKFDNVVHGHGPVGENEIAVPLTAQELANQRTIKVSVVGDSGESPAKDFRIT
jgi:hypothetical protein